MTSYDADSYQESEIDLREVFRVLWLRKLFLVVFVCLSSLLAFLYIQKLPNIYSSTALIMLKTQTKSADAIQSLITGSITAAENTETELHLIRSKNILSQVAERLELHKHPAFQIKAKPTDKLKIKKAITGVTPDSIVKKLLGNLSVNQLTGSEFNCYYL